MTLFHLSEFSRIAAEEYSPGRKPCVVGRVHEQAPKRRKKSHERDSLVTFSLTHSKPRLFKANRTEDR